MKILVTSTQWPYHGGAATNAYALIKYLRRKGHEVCGFFFNEKGRPNIDPDGIGGVFLARSTSLDTFKKCAARELGGKPDIILAKNYVAPVYSKKAFPDVKVVYLVSGARNMIEFSKRKISAQKYLKSDFSGLEFGKNYKGVIYKSEIDCVKKSDYYICNSQISKDVFLKNFKNFLNEDSVFEPINTSVFLNNYTSSNKSFANRSIDILYASSNLKRDVKNFKFANQIFNYLNNTLNLNLKIVVAGANFNSKNKIKGVKYMGVLPNKSITKMMCNSKLVINTSYFDASPNVITEAIHSNANILVSKNCGWSEIYKKESVCSDVYSVREWANKCVYLLQNRIDFSLDVSSEERKFLNALRKTK